MPITDQAHLPNFAYVTLDLFPYELTITFALLPHRIMICFINVFGGQAHTQISVMSTLNLVLENKRNFFKKKNQFPFVSKLKLTP